MIEPPFQFEHEQYEELCALATTGTLTANESATLLAHLGDCAECSEAFAEYRSLAAHGMPHLVSRFAPTAESGNLDQELALARLLKSADNLEPQAEPVPIRTASLTSHPLWRVAVAAVLLAGIAFGSYRAGERTRKSSTPTVVVAGASKQSIQSSAEQAALKAALQTDRQREAELEALAASRGTDTDKLRADEKAAQDRLDDLNASLAASKADAATQIAALTQDRDATAARFRDAQASYVAVQDELNTLRNQHRQDTLHLASLEDKVTGLNALLDDRDKHVKNDEQYLASDKDIRDLIGARNLYIADIMDVDESGNSKKPFGRVFYTKTKSLVFYAYDLDRQPGVKQASTFQVWGRNGVNDRKPVNLGVLFMDSETNHRWALRVNDPQQLAQLDAIFVTVEPHIQSEKPTGKPFLYASLRRDPNHP